MQTIIFWLITPIFFILIIPFIPVVILLNYKNKHGGFKKIARFWALVLLRLAGVKVKVNGLENLQEESCILAVNHQSMMDIMIVLAYIPLDFHFIAKQSLFKIPIFGTILRTGGYFPINRTSPIEAKKTMDNIANKIIKENSSILMFPEGTRGHNGRLLPLKKGCASLAHATGAVIYPVGIQNSWRIVKKGSLKINPSKITVNIGSGLKVEKQPDNTLDTAKLRKTTLELQEKLAQLI